MNCAGPNERDYYEILGVLRTANLAEITAAYHALARQCHPDIGADDAQSLATFKLISQAYEVLSDERKRREYDRRRSSPRSRPFSVQPGSFSDQPGFANYSNSWFHACWDTRPTPATGGPSQNDVQVDLPISPEEARHGGPCQFTLTLHQDCLVCDGRGRVADDTCVACSGHGQTQEQRSLEFHLPPGAQSGGLFRIAGQGRRLANSRGDLWVRFKVQPCW